MKTIFTKAYDRFVIAAKLADDKMKLFIDVEPVLKAEEGRVDPPIAAEELLAAIKEFVRLDLVNRDVVEDVAACATRGEKVQERRIVKGTEAQTGADGKVVFLVKKFTGEGEISVDEKGFANFYDRHMFENITQGTIVGRIYPPKPGVDGMDALGKTLPAKAGKPAKVTVDRTLVVKNAPDPGDNFQIITAEMEGYLNDDHGRLSIKNELVVSGDLDFHLGTIDFIGLVRVRGDVMPGFSIKARKGIEISGSVREASLSCAEGKISVRGHVYGGERARIVGGGDFECTVAQEVDVEVVGNIIIAKEATDSRLRSQASLLLETGTLAGGEAFTVCGVLAKALGTEAGQPTKIHLCSDVEMSAEYGRLLLNIESHEKAIRMINLHLGPYGTHPERMDSLAAGFRTRIERLLAKRSEVEQSRIRLAAKKAEKLKAAKYNPVLRVSFNSVMHEGVSLRAGEDVFTANEAVKGPASVDYVPAEHGFKVGEFKPLECSFYGAAMNKGESDGSRRPK